MIVLLSYFTVLQHIPRTINPIGRKWRAGEKVLMRTDNGSWSVGIVYNHRSPRFSAGWNIFAKDNEFALNDTLIFTLVEDDNAPVAFDVQLG